MARRDVPRDRTAETDFEIICMRAEYQKIDRLYSHRASIADPRLSDVDRVAHPRVIATRGDRKLCSNAMTFHGPDRDKLPAMADHAKTHARRYVRAVGPFNGYHLGLRKTPVLIFNLNVGGGFVNFPDEQPIATTFVLTIELPEEGRVTVLAQTVYRDPSGLGVRFVDLEQEDAERLRRAVERAVAGLDTTSGAASTE